MNRPKFTLQKVIVKTVTQGSPCTFCGEIEDTVRMPFNNAQPHGHRTGVNACRECLMLALVAINPIPLPAVQRD